MAVASSRAIPRLRATALRLPAVAGAGVLATAATAWACARSPILIHPVETAL